MGISARKASPSTGPRREVWVHPVTSGSEPTVDRAAIWRFRIIVALLLTAVAIGVGLLVVQLRGSDSPASTSVLRAPLSSVLAR